MLDSRTLMAMNARAAVVALATEVELTLRVIEQLPSDPPTADDVENLRRTLEFRRQQVDREMRATLGALQGAISAELLLDQRRARG